MPEALRRCEDNPRAAQEASLNGSFVAPQLAITLLLAFWRLPQLYLIALRVHDPAKLAELRFLSFLQDVTSFSTECGQESMKIGHPVIDHERCSARGEVLAISDGPSGFPRNCVP